MANEYCFKYTCVDSHFILLIKLKIILKNENIFIIIQKSLLLTILSPSWNGNLDGKQHVNQLLSDQFCGCFSDPIITTYPSF